MSDHARLAPSGSDIWGPDGCPGSIAMQASQPEQEDTEESREGTAAHWLLSQTLRNVTVSPDAIAANGVPINDEMAESIQELVADVRATVANCQAGDYWQDEQRVYAHKFIHPDNDGTPDVYFVQHSRKTLYVWDFKYGHRFVDVYGCWQLINYAAAIFETEKITDWTDWTVVLTIAQPRCYVKDELGGTLRHWITSGKELAPLFLRLADAAAATDDPNAPCKTGPHCLDCRAAWDCTANLRAGGAVVDVVYGQQYEGMGLAAMGLYAKTLAAALKRGKDIQAAIDAKILEIVSSGQNVPWHSLDYSKPRTMWDKTRQAEAAAFVQMFGVPVEYGVDIPTPAQVIKLGVDATVISPYTTKANGAKKLVRVDETNAAKVFGTRG